jgi:DNA-binding transcriptional MerR regulator
MLPAAATMSAQDRQDKLQKLYFRIGEVSSIVGVEPHVLRYWESEFKSVRPQKSARGQRIYSRRDVDTLLKVKELLYSHRFTIAGAKRKLKDGTAVEPAVEAAVAQVEPPVPQVGASAMVAVRERLVNIRDQLRSLLGELDGWGEN